MELKMNDLTKEFQDITAVNHVTYTMHNGVYGLLGVNGAGKTTLMRMLCTLLKPTAGSITCNGQDIFKMDGEYRKLLGCLPQEFGFYPDFTVRDYLMYIASIKGIRPVVAKKRVKELLHKVGLANVENKKMKKLSGGMKRRAGIDPKGLASVTDGVDLWLAGHEHTTVNEAVIRPDGKTALVVETGYNLWNFGNVKIECSLDADGNLVGDAKFLENLIDYDTGKELGADRSSYLMPGVERVDIIKKEDGSYQAKSVWCREDLKDTCMIKFSTGTGYYYGYTQDESTSEWGFFALDYDTGETVLWEPVSDEEKYNNIAVGIMQGDNGNSVYCPTNSQILVRLQDRFAYLPEEPEKKLDITKMTRAVLSDEEFRTASGSEGTPATYLQSAVVEDAGNESMIAFCVNGLDKTKGEYVGYYMKSDGTLERIDNLILTDEKGDEVEEKEEMNEKSIYELRVTADASGDMNLAEEEGCITVAVILAVK